MYLASERVAAAVWEPRWVAAGEVEDSGWARTGCCSERRNRMCADGKGRGVGVSKGIRRV